MKPHQDATLLITNCTIVTLDRQERIIEKGAITVKDTTITSICEHDEASRITAERTIDAQQKIAMPGLVNCHTHLPMTLFRGIAEDLDLQTWLETRIWPAEAKLTPRDIYHGALLGCLEMVKNGTTCFADMYFHEDKIAEATRKTGIRGVLAPGIIEAGNRRRGVAMLQDAARFAEKFNNHADGRIRTQLGPHAVYTCSPQLLKETKAKADALGVGLHIHLAESLEKAREVEKQHGVSEVELLQRIGFLGSNVLAAHCIHLSEKDMKTMAAYEVKAAYNPVANMKLAQGTARVKDLQAHGVIVGLGTDGPASNNSLNMWETMKIAALAQKAAYNDSKVLPAKEALKMATINGAKTLGLEKQIGTLEPGKRADIILVDAGKPHLTPLHNVYASLVYSAQASDVDTVIVDGKILMEKRRVKTLNEKKVMEQAENAARDLLNR